MNKKSCLLVVVGLSVMALVGFSLAGTARAVEAQLIKIQPVGDVSTNDVTGLSIDPAKLTVKKNTIVVWMNGVPKELQVVFKEGKKCADVTANPTRFSMNSSQCYVTSFIPFGDTSTLQFPTAGAFEYQVQSEDGKLMAKGIIEVK